jgi:transposase
MLSLPASVRIFLFGGNIDMRKGFDGLATLVRSAGHDVFSGHLFVFVSREANRVKVLTWQRGGYVLWYKRLERGRFRRPAMPPDGKGMSLGADELALLLEGFDTRNIRRPKRWEPKQFDGERET